MGKRALAVAAVLAASMACAATTAMAQSARELMAIEVAQAPNDALQAAIDAKDVPAIFALLNATPRDQRGDMATRLLAAAQGSADKQYAASLAALAFLSGGLTQAQQNVALAIVRAAPGGLAIVATLLSNNAGGFGFALDSAGLTLASGENRNQSASGNQAQNNGTQN